MGNIDIIYEDTDIIMCRKPAGVATQTRQLGQQDMESLLRNYRAKKKEDSYIGVVHRLDQPVEGLMVFGKHQQATRELSKQIQNNTIVKKYYAISEKSPDTKEGKLQDYLISDKKQNKTSVVSPVRENQLPREAKKASLEYKVVEEREGQVLFDIQLHTGRQHQIRVQLANIGCPLVGDAKYGEETKNACGKKSGLALCSYYLSFCHPRSREKMVFEIEPKGEQFSIFFEKLEKEERKTL